eukprot:gb/GECG01013299.1/.p1 GENE.gb/GECG01013299.1/~~gb/GECG01013299.1/.p1  ORF type:complete len:139 (+),score=6.70 gb/GECG01013299.1/:1-417(+)
MIRKMPHLTTYAYLPWLLVLSIDTGAYDGKQPASVLYGNTRQQLGVAATFTDEFRLAGVYKSVLSNFDNTPIQYSVQYTTSIVLAKLIEIETAARGARQDGSRIAHFNTWRFQGGRSTMLVVRRTTSWQYVDGEPTNS